MQKIGLTAEEIAAIGDGENDAGMLQMAGCGAAMGSAPEHLKALADMVCPSAAEDGAAVFCREVFPEAFSDG